ncbi:N-acetyltransferase [Helicobacter anseris]|uniref:N-acetyltransferase n=1 Tax=Helicobacter anseris TaxID=375926 RepID=A0A3D8JA08_9HELI|nr:N-acetyltransferase [Helicobacter anseris]RDU74258.1 N-acetyltransferase [Helicobacter anseris]
MILKAQKYHLEALYQIEQECFGDDIYMLSKNNIAYHIKKGNILIYLSNQKIAGYILTINYKHSIRIYSLAIRQEFLKMGIATKLCQKVIQTSAKKVYLEVRKSNQIAIKLYEKLGFKIIKELPLYYQNEDGLKMLYS